MKASIEDERGFSGVNPWSTKLVCGKCGNYFRIKHRHYKACWECRDGYKKPDPCKNSYIYETARDWHVKEIMKTALVDGSKMEMELKPCWPEERKVRRRG